MIYSNWFALSSASSKTTTTLYPGTLFETFALRYTFAVQGAPSGVVNNGTLLMYFRPSPSDAVYPFPVGSYNGQVNMQLESFTSTTCTILLFRGPGSAAVSELYDEDAASFRYVVIPGGTAAGGRSRTVDYGNYEQVISYYGIPR